MRSGFGPSHPPFHGMVYRLNRQDARMAISPISSHACTRRGDKIRAVLTVVEAWSRVVFCHPSRRGSNSAVAPVVACVVLTFTLAFVDDVRGAIVIVDCAEHVHRTIQHVLLTALAATPGSSPTQSRPTRGTRCAAARPRGAPHAPTRRHRRRHAVRASKLPGTMPLRCRVWAAGRCVFIPICVDPVSLKSQTNCSNRLIIPTSGKGIPQRTDIETKTRAVSHLPT
jgi:hypothetical protein